MMFQKSRKETNNFFGGSRVCCSGQAAQRAGRRGSEATWLASLKDRAGL